jgi:hypothetical protein
MKLSLLACALTLAVVSAAAEPDLGSAVLSWNGVVFVESKISHSLRNVGDVDTVYFAFQGL